MSTLKTIVAALAGVVLGSGLTWLFGSRRSVKRELAAQGLTADDLQQQVKKVLAEALAEHGPESLSGQMLASLDEEKHQRSQRRRPKRLILIRHGESLGNVDTSVYEHMPDNQIPLSPRGVQQAIEAGEKLRCVVGDSSIMFFVSPFRRSRETFENIAQAFSDRKWMVREDPRLREQEWGNLQPAEQAYEVARHRKHVGRFYYRFPTGESGADVYDRCDSFLDSMLRQFDQSGNPETAIIVSHGLFLRLLLMRYYRWSVERFERMDNLGNCEYIVMDLLPDGHYAISPSTPLRLSESQAKSLQSRYAPLRPVPGATPPVAVPAQQQQQQSHGHSQGATAKQQLQAEQTLPVLTGADLSGGENSSSTTAAAVTELAALLPHLTRPESVPCMNIPVQDEESA